MKLQVIALKELLEMKFDERESIAGQLEAAARILRQNLDGGGDASAAWRVADAGLELRELIERTDWKAVGGVHEPTGLGAMLPKRVVR